MQNDARRLSLLAGLILAGIPLAAAAETEEALLANLYGDEATVSIATGRRQPIAYAPAIASVITAEDIERLGANDLDEVLETVPGLHVARGTVGYNPIYSIRGIYSTYNPEVLVLVNGQPINALFTGDRHQIWGGYPLKDVQRIEVIRGPGSAVYGADAFSGVVNIITKSAADIGGTRAGVRTGSYNDKGAWLLHGSENNGHAIAVSLQYDETDGSDAVIGRDAQSLLDQIFGTHASLAPGRVSTGRRALDARIDYTTGPWSAHADYQGRHDWGTGAGLAQALDPQGRFGSDRAEVGVGWHQPRLTENWDLQVDFSARNTTEKVENDVLIFPPGAFAGTYPQGVIGNPENSERQYRLDAAGVYSGIERHRLRFGAGWFYGRIYDLRESKNFYSAADGSLAPLGSVVDVSGTDAVFMQPHERRDGYLSVQDEWELANDWTLTAGVRHDDYSDFGGTTNPRLALVWRARYDLTGKLLYGRAFRAPAFAELYNINNPTALGNPNLKPETIDFLEMGWDYRGINDVTLGANVYAYRWQDMIRFLPDPAPATSSTARNSGEQDGQGFELEAKWRVKPNWTLQANYSYEHATDKETEAEAANSPRQKAYLRSDWEMMPSWRLNTQLLWVGPRARAPQDSRGELGDYTQVNFALRHAPEREGWGVTAALRNALDAKAYEPSPASTGGIVFIPGDLPLPGRNFFVEVDYRF